MCSFLGRLHQTQWKENNVTKAKLTHRINFEIQKWGFDGAELWRGRRLTSALPPVPAFPFFPPPPELPPCDVLLVLTTSSLYPFSVSSTFSFNSVTSSLLPYNNFPMNHNISLKATLKEEKKEKKLLALKAEEMTYQEVVVLVHCSGLGLYLLNWNSCWTLRLIWHECLRWVGKKQGISSPC